MRRLLPFRITDEHNVVNMFALEDAYINNATTTNGNGDEGVFVKITSGNLTQDAPIYYGQNPYQGKTNYPHVYDNLWPASPLRVAPANAADPLNCFGVTLAQTCLYDENGEKLLSNSVKRDENTVVMPGESVKILTKGTITISKLAFDGALAVASGVKLSTNSGKLTGCALSDANRLGKVLLTGNRVTSGDGYLGQTALIEFGFN